MIDIDALRVGMFVHLDMGWMSHPFPLGSFKITSAEQMATIRTLGLKRLRWSPQQSDPAEAPEPEVKAWGPPGEAGAALACRPQPTPKPASMRPFPRTHARPSRPR